MTPFFVPTHPDIFTFLGQLRLIEAWIVIALLGVGSYFFCSSFRLLGCLVLGTGSYFFSLSFIRDLASNIIPQPLGFWPVIAFLDGGMFDGWCG